MTKKILAAVLLSLTIGWSNAQTLKVGSTVTKPSSFGKNIEYEMKRTCGSVVPDEQWERDFQVLIDKYNQDKAAGRVSFVNYTIPVVIHIIHGGQAIGTFPNISNAQAVSQINVLNADFAGTGLNVNQVPAAFSSLVSNTGIQFCLAQQDLNGNQMSEIGVDRVNYNNLTVSGSASKNPADASYNTPALFQNFINTVVKPQTIWDPTKYMNIWVTDQNSAVGLLGFATFPSGSGLTGIPGGTGGLTTDGLWCWSRCFGNTGTLQSPYNRGRTASHEIGHWLGLRHIWGDDGTACTGSDFCNDTPNQADENYGCPTFATNTSCSNTGDMSMNFMDYTNDACMYLFTPDQTTRIQTAMLNGTLRKNLNNSGKCNPVNTSAPPVADFTGTPTTIPVGGTVNFTNASTGNGNTYSWSANPTTGVTWNTSTATNPTATFANAGTYTINLTATNANGNNTKTRTGYIIVNPQSGGCDTLSNAEAADTLTAFRLGTTWGYYPGNTDYNLSYAEQFTNTTVGTLTDFFIAVLQADQRSTNKQITFKVYNWSASNTPGTQIANGSKSVLYSSLTAGQYNQITFNPPVNITGNFFISMELPTASTPQDTVIFGVNINRGNPGHQTNTSYVKYNGAWYDAPSLLAGVGNTAYEVIPVICPAPNTVNSVSNLENNLNIFPNPTNGILNILLNFEKSTDAVVTISNILGENVKVESLKGITSRNILIDLSDKAKGTYFVNIKTDKGSLTKKVVLSN